MAAVARRMVAAVVARAIVDGAAMPPQDTAAARIAGNRIHQVRLPFVIRCGATKPPHSNRCRRKIMP
jgi:ribosomal protein L40E